MIMIINSIIETFVNIKESPRRNEAKYMISFNKTGVELKKNNTQYSFKIKRKRAQKNK